MTDTITTIGEIVRGEREVFPPYLYAAYQSTRRRAPSPLRHYNLSLLQEVAGDFGVYLDIGDFAQSLKVVRGLISDPAARRKLEQKIRRGYAPITWRSVAEKAALLRCHPLFKEFAPAIWNARSYAA